MKTLNKIILVILFLMPLGLFAQLKPIDGVLGIKFGESQASVLATIKARGGIVKNTLDQTRDFSTYNNVRLGGRETVSVSFRFVQDKVYNIQVMFKAETEPFALDLYNDILKDVTSVYGQGEKMRSFKSPYKEGDGSEIRALKFGYATIKDLWLDTTRDRNIKLEISDRLIISLSYHDGELLGNGEKLKNPLKDY